MRITAVSLDPPEPPGNTSIIPISEDRLRSAHYSNIERGGLCVMIEMLDCERAAGPFVAAWVETCEPLIDPE